MGITSSRMAALAIPLLLLAACSTGSAFTAAAAPPRGPPGGPGISCLHAGAEVALEEGVPPGLRTLPPDLGPRPRGVLLPTPLGRYAVLVDAADPARPPRMWVDAAGDGDLAADAPLSGEWHEGRTAYVSGEAILRLPAPGAGTRGFPLHLSCRVPLDGPATLEVVAAEWLLGRVPLGGREFPFALRDADGDGDYSRIAGVEIGFDRDGDGVIDGGREFGECYAADGRFDLGTGTFRISSIAEDGSAVTFEPAWPAAAVRPFLGVGDPAPPIPGTDLDGRPISLEEYRGRTVLLLFWAEW